MKSTRILIKTPFKMRCPAAICSDLRGVNSSLCIGHFCTENANLSKILQDVYSESSRNGVKSGWGYYLNFIIYIFTPHHSFIFLFGAPQHFLYFKPLPHGHKSLGYIFFLCAIGKFDAFPCLLRSFIVKR